MGVWLGHCDAWVEARASQQPLQLLSAAVLGSRQAGNILAAVLQTALDWAEGKTARQACKLWPSGALPWLCMQAGNVQEEQSESQR